MTTDYADFLPIAVQAVELGAKRFLSQTVEVVKSKDGDKDPVSDVDLAIEEDVRTFLTDETPEVNFLGEETGGKAEGLWWCLDPIDGTANYLRGGSLCGISLALIDGDRPVVGVISLPRLDELYEASEGNGTQFNGKRVTTPPIEELSEAVIAFGDFAFGEKASVDNPIRLKIMGELATEALRIRMLGSAAADLAWLAKGSVNGSITLINNPWDIAAGALIANEAGAVVVDETGRPYTTSARYVFGGSHPRIAETLLTIARDGGQADIQDEIDRATLEDYKAGYARFIECLGRNGISHIEHGFSKDTQRFSYAVEADADGNDPSEKCYQATFAEIDELWQLKLERTRDSNSAQS